MTTDSTTLLAHFGLTPQTLPKLAGGAEYLAVQLPHGLPEACLDADERQRAMAYGNPVAARHFTASRALLRAVLSHYLGCAPAAIAYVVQDHGKPVLAAPYTHQLHFSLARRDGWCAIALCRNQPVGVDIEQVRELPGMEDVAALYFSAQDCKALNQLSGSAKQRRFFELWTALEAIGKRLGSGLTEAGEASGNKSAHVSHNYLEMGWLVAVAV
ncbi:MAG: 4'-phosphopantetheinyl transferase superfamily protein [Thiobacillus sp.]|nr:4'-phosphopantetheinyl transferase superfamily protein [Thiobacillus sp.]